MNAEKRWKKRLLPILLAGVFALTACGNNTSAPNTNPTDSGTAAPAPAQTPKSGGVLNIAYPAKAATLDPHTTTNASTKDIARQIFETLVTLNSKYEVVPMLAESYEVSKDGLTITFPLRKGVKFHNGKEMTADDVVASMNKWLKISTQGKANLPGATFTAKDPYTAVLNLKKPSLLTLHILADSAPFPAIMPKEIIDESGVEAVKTFVGTGPFQLEEWKQDQYVHLKKYNDYSSRTEPSDGLGGKKEALVDDVYFHFVADESTRVAGITTGEYDIAFSIPFDNAEQIENTPGVKSFISEGGMTTFVFNKKSGLFSNEKARQAVNAALNVEEILISAYRDKRFYTLDSGLALPNQTDWYSDAGKEEYNQHNLEKAKKLLAESGYKGEEVTILVTRDYPDYYNAAVVAQQQLKEIGLNTKLDVYDWPTMQERRKDEKTWDFFVVGFAVRPTLHQLPFLDSRAEYPGWTNSPEIDKLLDDIQGSATIAEAKPLVDQLQSLAWKELPIIKLGNRVNQAAIADHVQGLQDVIGPILWNVSTTKQ
ncbi:ABC transporter substrate-binding protein [Brevibacillus nitrificans]|uniref:ABC transporter substrate-binding protein n=1 Tax=Brevibacillus nitrificans TaxID=651560 RepID=UPI002E1C8408|nr:ABC transporter substrate-binding protein [Brevibacillus nitrificans]